METSTNVPAAASDSKNTTGSRPTHYLVTLGKVFVVSGDINDTTRVIREQVQALLVTETPVDPLEVVLTDEDRGES